jgi:hypothetical protein
VIVDTSVIVVLADSSVIVEIRVLAEIIVIVICHAFCRVLTAIEFCGAQFVNRASGT